MKVGCVKEIKNREYRVGLTPDNVKSYVNSYVKSYVKSHVKDHRYVKWKLNINNMTPFLGEVGRSLRNLCSEFREN